MKKVKLLCVGGLKFKSLNELAQDYSKRINRFVDFSIIQIKDPKFKDEKQNRNKEGELFLDKIQTNDTVIGCDEKGKPFDSRQFADFLNHKLTSCHGHLNFLIGGYSGLALNLQQKVHHKVSFSNMTFGHDIFRIIFLEQLYRAFTINNNIKYHR